MILDEVTNTIMAYLLAHEDDIAFGVNDFGELAPVFFAFFEREAKGTRNPVAQVVNHYVNCTGPDDRG